MRRPGCSLVDVPQLQQKCKAHKEIPRNHSWHGEEIESNSNANFLVDDTKRTDNSADFRCSTRCLRNEDSCKATRQLPKALTVNGGSISTSRLGCPTAYSPRS